MSDDQDYGLRRGSTVPRLEYAKDADEPQDVRSVVQELIGERMAQAFMHPHVQNIFKRLETAINDTGVRAIDDYVRENPDRVTHDLYFLLGYIARGDVG